MNKQLYNEEENTIILWKETDDGLYQLVFDGYNQVTYMFNGHDGMKTRNIFDLDFKDLKILAKNKL